MVTITIHTAKPGIVIGRGGTKVEELRNTLETLQRRPRSRQHPGDSHTGARRLPRGTLRRRPARTPRGLPPRRQAGRPAHHAARRARCTRGRRGPPRRRRDVSPRVGHAGPRPSPHPPRQHRLRHRRSAHDLRSYRREVLDLQGRHHPRKGRRQPPHRRGGDPEPVAPVAPVAPPPAEVGGPAHTPITMEQQQAVQRGADEGGA